MRDVRRWFTASICIERGKRVEALWEEDLNWYTATVEKDFQNGTVQIRWDDPDGWPVSSICDLEDLRVLRLSYKPGDLVVALFEEDYEWYNATVVQDKGGSFVVLWDDPDGGPELAVCLPEHLRMVEVVDDYKPGDLVEAMCDEDQTWYTAVVQERFDCGYVVLWDDPGDSPTSVCRPRYMKHIRFFSDYQVGDRVDARSETGEMLPAVVSEVHSGGTFQVQWEGARTGQRTSCCCSKDMKGVFREYSIGDRVEALYPDTWEWQVGVVRRYLELGAFLIRWDYPSGPQMSMCTPEEMMLLEDDDIDCLEDSFEPPSFQGEEIEAAELGPHEEPNLWQGRAHIVFAEPQEVQSTQIQLSKFIAMHGQSMQHARWWPFFIRQLLPWSLPCTWGGARGRVGGWWPY